MRVVIGSGPGGMRAAAARAADGGAVLLLQQEDTPEGRTAPELPEGTGRLHVPAEQRAAVERVIGPLVEAPDVHRALLARGSILHLPLSGMNVARLFEGQALPEVGRRWLTRRVRNALRPLTGEGQEERSYADWVIRRMGAPVYRHVYQDYARSRWGKDPSDLSCSVARVYHGDADAMGSHGQVTGGGPLESMSFAASVIAAGGGEVRVGVEVRSIRTESGRAVAVVTDEGEISLDGPLWIDRPPAVIAGWLGDALDSGLAHDARALVCADSVQVALQGGPDELPDELHLVGDSASFYRLIQSYGAERRIVFHATVPSGEDLDAALPARITADAARLGLEGFQEAGAIVERLRDHEPVWTPRCHARLRRLVLGWQALGIVAVGRQGMLTPMDVGTEVCWALAMAASDDPDQREGLRARLEPPVKQADLRASMSRFLVR